VLLNRHTHNILFAMNRDHNFVWPLGVAPSLFYMKSLPFYLDEVMLDKEVIAWPGVTVEKKKTSVSYTIPTTAQRSTLTETSDTGPGASKGTQTLSKSEEEVDDDEEESLPRGTLQILFSSIHEDATISGNQLWEVMTLVFP
jgi:hypothetical protein